MNRSGPGCATIIGILMLLSIMGRGGEALIPLVVMGLIVYAIVRQMQRNPVSPMSSDPVPGRQARPQPMAEPPVIDIPVTRAADAAATYSQPVSGPVLDLRLSFEAIDAASVARLVPNFVRDQVEIVDAGTRLLRAGWCEYSYRLRGPESVLRELCAYLDRPGYANLSAFW